jgi:hypothetical protein
MKHVFNNKAITTADVIRLYFKFNFRSSYSMQQRFELGKVAGKKKDVYNIFNNKSYREIIRTT